MSKRTDTATAPVAWTGTGYDAPGVSDSPLVFLSQKDQAFRLRLMTPPLRYEGIIPAKGTEPAKKTPRVAWGAILMETVNGVPTRRAVVFQSTKSVYDAVRKLSLSPSYGDPAGYDIIVTRTQDARQYYTVVVVAGTQKPVGPNTQKLYDDAAIDVAAVVAANQSEEEMNDSATVPGLLADEFTLD